jgi:hypothetical protein
VLAVSVGHLERDEPALRGGEREPVTVRRPRRADVSDAVRQLATVLAVGGRDEELVVFTQAAAAAGERSSERGARGTPEETASQAAP